MIFNVENSFVSGLGPKKYTKSGFFIKGKEGSISAKKTSFFPTLLHVRWGTDR